MRRLSLALALIPEMRIVDSVAFPADLAVVWTGAHFAEPTTVPTGLGPGVIVLSFGAGDEDAAALLLSVLLFALAGAGDGGGGSGSHVREDVERIEDVEDVAAGEVIVSGPCGEATDQYAIFGGVTGEARVGGSPRASCAGAMAGRALLAGAVEAFRADAALPEAEVP